MARYDPNLLRRYADRLYGLANWIATVWLIAGSIAGGILGLIFEAFPKMESRYSAVIIALIGGGIGLAIGLNRSFQLRVQAQQILCQVAIEENIRRIRDE